MAFNEYFKGLIGYSVNYNKNPEIHYNLRN